MLRTARAALAALSATSPQPPAVAALVSELATGAVPSAFRLIPAGAFRADDGSGRPADVPAWVMTDEDGARLVAELAARHRDTYIDYEHATLHAKRSGTPAPAAGWFKALEWRPGSGLWATGVEWVAAARQQIAERAYRYISPLFTYDKRTGRVLSLLGASLTNDPGLDGLTDLAALAAQVHFPATPPKLEKPAMPETLKKLLASLGLADTATEAEALSAVAALKTNVAALSAQVGSPDPAKFVPIGSLAALQGEHATLQSQHAALSAEVLSGKVAKVVADAETAGKLTPALNTWATDLGTRDLAALSAYLEAMPVIVKPGSTQTNGQGGEGNGLAALSADERKLCALLAIPEDDYKATKATAAA